MPGWVDNLNGPTGLLVGAGKGVIRSMYCKANYNAEVIPVDFAINALIVNAWKVATQEKYVLLFSFCIESHFDVFALFHK